VLASADESGRHDRVPAESGLSFSWASRYNPAMKLRHAAALALTGWYLMLPPTIPDSYEVNQGAPLSQWTIRNTFPRNAGCENAKYRMREQALAAQAEHSATGRRGHGNPDVFCIRCNAQCVAEDDPRLKAKVTAPPVPALPK
jgi:hypothetical protein